MAIRCFFERQRCLCFFWFMFARFHRWPRWHPLTLSIKHNWVWPGGITWPILEEAQIEGNFVVISKHNITLRIMISKLDTARAINLNTLSDNVPRPRRAGGTQMSTSTQTLLEGSKPLGHRSHCMLSMCWIKHHLLSHDLLKIDESSRVEQLQQRRSFLGNHDLLRPSQRMMGAWRVLTYLPHSMVLARVAAGAFACGIIASQVDPLWVAQWAVRITVLQQSPTLAVLLATPTHRCQGTYSLKVFHWLGKPFENGGTERPVKWFSCFFFVFHCKYLYHP